MQNRPLFFLPFLIEKNFFDIIIIENERKGKFMRVNIKRTRPEGEVGMREILVKAFNFERSIIRYFTVRAKTDDAAFHRVKDYLKGSVPDNTLLWYTTVKKNSDEYAKGYLKAVHLN